MGADHHAVLSSRPVMCRKRTVSHCFISLALLQYYISSLQVFMMSLCLFIFLFQEGQSSQNLIVSALPHPPPPLTQAKKWAGKLWKINTVITQSLTFKHFHELNELWHVPALSVFDREDDTSSRSGGLAAIERRQADRRKELMRAQTMPKASAMQARKAMIEKFEKDGGG